MKLNVLALCAIALSVNSARAADDAEDVADDAVINEGIAIARAQVDWIRKEGGFFHDKLQIQPFDTTDPKSPMGVFAVENISKDTTLMIIPNQCLLTAGEYDSESTCDTARNLVKQRKLGDESKFAAYVNYLFHRNNPGQLPAAWSEAGQELLETIIGPYMPPYDVTAVSFADECGEDDNADDDAEEDFQLLEEAYHLVRKRSWDDKMLPVFDMCNHRNGKWKSVDSNSAHEGNDIEVKALRDIQKGEQLYLSYNECADCDFAHTYVLQHIIKDFGFVEQYPRRWRFPTRRKDLVFELDEKDNGELELTWLSGPPNETQLRVLHAELGRVREIREYVAIQAAVIESEHERSVCVEFYDALTTALEHALRKGDPNHQEECAVSADGSDAGTCEAAGTTKSSTIPLRDYDDFEVPADYMEYNGEVCDYHSIQELHEELFERSDSLQSQYNKIDYFYSEELNDTCLRLNDHLQACASFRPHYHEVFVHYPARYVDEVKRIAYLGGGDNMIVHEILKYPNLELAVGMELDHHVVRSSFTNLGTQPHFDDPRLQWWFGDASKSLLLLPEEYYGTFDVVLLDLQTEVAEILMVTEELNIMDAAMLLMKPDGVIARNEDWEFGTSKPFTDYAVDLYYIDVPVICHQGITLGSNSVDFLKRPPTDHKIDTLYLKPVGEADRFDFWYNYRRSNVHASRVSKLPGRGEQGAGNAGVLLVLEAEDADVPLKSSAPIHAGISAALRTAGLKELAVKLSTSKTGDGYEIVFILQEGYVVARAWPEHKYCAFDIQLWTSIEKQTIAEKELIDAIGSKNSSSYRFITGGMFGMPKGNVVESPRAAVDVADESASDKSASIDLVLGEAISMLENKESPLFILCGEESQPCQSLDILSKEGVGLTSVLPLRTCSNLVTDPEKEDFQKSMYECEQETLRTLAGVVKTQGKKIGGIVIDAKTPVAMGQILLEVLRNQKLRGALLARNHVILSVSTSLSETWWHKVILDRFREDLAVVAPAHNALAYFAGLELGVFSSHDELFYSHFMSIVDRVETTTGIASKIPSVKNGVNSYVEDFVPSKTFKHSDYDPSDAMAQWNSQRALGVQTLLEFTSELELSTPRVKKGVEDALGGGDVKVEGYAKIGDGCVAVAQWSKGSVIVSWDGRAGLSVNMFAENPEQVSAFEVAFAEKLNAVKTSLEDFPRGIGRVVNFGGAEESKERPHWA